MSIIRLPNLSCERCGKWYMLLFLQDRRLACWYCQLTETERAQWEQHKAAYRRAQLEKARVAPR